MSPTLKRALRGASLGATLVWALITGVAHGLFSVVVLALYRLCLGAAIAVGAVVFSLFRIDSTASRDIQDREN